MPDDMNLRDYVDMRIDSHKETIDQQLKSINYRISDITEISTKTLADAEKRISDKLDDRDKALVKADEVLDERLDQMNRFRDQINSERIVYVTRDQLEVHLKGLHDQIGIMTRTMTLSSGKTEGVSSVGSFVLAVLVGASALMSGISTFLIITQTLLKH